jgi:hypothetical protein
MAYLQVRAYLLASPDNRALIEYAYDNIVKKDTGVDAPTYFAKLNDHLKSAGLDCTEAYVSEAKAKMNQLHVALADHESVPHLNNADHAISTKEYKAKISKKKAVTKAKVVRRRS